MKDRKSVVKKMISVPIFFLLLVTIGILIDEKVVFAKNPNRVKVSFDRLYSQYDVTQDGIPDDLYISTDYFDDDHLYQNNLKIYVNNKLAFTDSDSVFCAEEEKWVQCELLTLKSGEILLYLYLGGDNGDGSIKICAYDSGIFNEILDVKKDIGSVGSHISTKITKVNNNDIYMSISAMSYEVGDITFERVYTYKNGRLIAKGKSGKIRGYYRYYSGGTQYRKKYLTANKTIKVTIQVTLLKYDIGIA